MRLSLSTGSLYVYPLRATFRLAQEAGFDGVELVVGPEVLCRGAPAVRWMAQACGLAVFSVHPPLLPLPGWRTHRATIAKLVSLAQGLGASLVVVHPPGASSWQHPRSEIFLQALDAVQHRLTDGPIRIGVENSVFLPSAPRLLSQPHALHAFAEARDLGVVLDTAHAASLPCSLESAYERLDDRLVNVHLSDVRESCRLPNVLGLHSCLKRHQFPGEGRLPLADLLRRLSADGYQGLVTIELSPLSLRIWSPQAARRRLHQVVTWVRAVLDTSKQQESGSSTVTLPR